MPGKKVYELLLLRFLSSLDSSLWLNVQLCDYTWHTRMLPITLLTFLKLSRVALCWLQPKNNKTHLIFFCQGDKKNCREFIRVLNGDKDKFHPLYDFGRSGNASAFDVMVEVCDGKNRIWRFLVLWFFSWLWLSALWFTFSRVHIMPFCFEIKKMSNK